MQKAFMHALLLGLASLVAGCGSGNPPDLNTEVFHVADRNTVSAFEYRIDPPDQITFRAPRVKELDGKTQTVSPDGKISLTLFGSIYVAGKTPDEVVAELKRIGSQYYEPSVLDIKVEVAAQSKYFTVFGPGGNTLGKFPYTGGNTVISALADAGISDQGWPEKVLLNRPLRSNADGSVRPQGRVTVDFNKIETEGAMTQNYLIEANDIIYLDRNPLDDWSHKLTQIIGPLTGASTLANAGGSVVKPGTVVSH